MTQQDEGSAGTATLAYSIPQLAKATGLSHPTLYKEIKAGRLRSFQVGRRRLISREAAQEYIDALEASGTRPADTRAALKARWPAADAA